MIGNVPNKADDKGFIYNNFQFYVGVYGDEFYTDAKLVVETVKGGGRYGDPKADGSTWKALATKQADTPVGDAYTTAQREAFMQEFINLANTALVKWASENGGGVAPEIPKDFWGWLRWNFLYRVQFDTVAAKLTYTKV
jgi:hypothetical protein